MTWNFRIGGAALLALALSRAVSGDEKSVARMDQDGDPLPSGAVARIGTTRFWHGSDGSEILFAPDGKQLISICSDGLIHITDFATGKDLRLLDPETQGSRRVIALAPDGRTLASAGYQPLTRIWDIREGKELRRLEGKDTYTTGLAFSHDGKLLAISCGNGGVHLWDTRVWREILSIPSKFPEAVVFLPDNKTLLVAEPMIRVSATLRWLDTATGKEIRKVVKQSSAEGQLFAFSANGTKAAVVVNMNQLCLWNAVTGEEIASTTLEKSNGVGGYYRLAFSRDGRTLACASGSRILFVDDGSGRVIKRWGDEEPDTGWLTFSPDGKTLVFAPAGIIQAKDVETGRSLLPAPRFPSPVSDVQFSTKVGEVLVSGQDGWTKSFDALTGKPRSVLLEPHDPRLALGGTTIVATTVAADGKSIALAASDLRVHVWDASAGKLLSHIEVEPMDAAERKRYGAGTLNEAVSLSPDGKYAYFIQRDKRSGTRGTASIWYARTGKLSTMLPEVLFEPKMSRGSITMEDCGYSRPPRAFSPGGRLLAVVPKAHGARAVQIWDFAAGKERPRITWTDDTYVESMALPDDRHLVTVFKTWHSSPKQEQSLRIWSTATGKELRSIALPKEPFPTMTPSPDARTLALASAKDGKPFVLLLELASLRERQRFPGHADSLCFSRDGRLLATNGGDRTVLMWDLTGICPDGRWSARDSSTEELERLWTDLQDDDGAKAYRAMWSLAAAQQAPVFLAARVQPAEAAGERLAKLIADLDDGRYVTREKASLELKKMGDLALTAARQALESGPSLEAKQRLERIIAYASALTPSGPQLRQLRAVEALENARSPAARRVLESLAAGEPAARLTREARGALARLSK